MLATMTALAVHAQQHPGWTDGHGGWGGGGPGWWLVFPIVFWVLVLSVLGFVLYRWSSGQSARRVAERTLAERFAGGEISEDELRHRRAVLRGKA